ncbi:MAG: NAD-dependent epimerase/dehydratase family protein [Bacteroidota bacterium]
MENTSGLKLILTGATGMVGEGVLHECLLRDDVVAVLIINRKPSGITHPKLKEIIHADFFDLSPIENELTNYDGCLFCLGVSSVGMKEPEYFKMTYTLTMNVAQTLSRLNDGMTFCYISGASTDSSEKGKLMWARVKGKTENDLIKLPFKKVYNFRPGIIEPTKGLKNTLGFYKYFGWLLSIIKLFWSNGFCTLKQLGDAMINAVKIGYEKQVLEIKDIKLLSQGTKK